MTDTSCEPSEGLLEVKYLASVTGLPEDAIEQKANYCLERTGDGQVQLKRSDKYYYQVYGQLGCTDKLWCDVVCMSKSQETFLERIYFDRHFWNECILSLRQFYRNYLCPELVFPTVHSTQA